VIQNVKNASEVKFERRLFITDLPDRDNVFWMEEAEDKGMDIVGQMLEINEALSRITHIENCR